MNNLSKISRILFFSAAGVLAVVFAVRMAKGYSPVTAGLWLGAAVMILILAIALKPEDGKARGALIGASVTLCAALMVLSYTFGRLAGPIEREAYAPAAPTDEPADNAAEPTAEEPVTLTSSDPTLLPHISWTEEHYVDDFNDPTDETYLRGRFVGTFSNSATSGSLLNAFLYFDKDLPGHKDDSFHIRLFEYGDNVVEFYHTELYEVTIKIKIDGKTYQAHPDRITEKNIYVKRGSAIFEPIIRALNQEKDIAVVITVSDGLTDTYRFDIDPYGLEGLSHNWK